MAEGLTEDAGDTVRVMRGMALVKDPRSLKQRFAARFGLATKFRSVVPAEAGQCEQ